MRYRRRARKSGLFAVVALFHVAICWLILANDKALPRAPAENSALVLITLPRPPESPRPVQDRAATLQKPSRKREIAKREVQTAPITATPGNSQQDTSHDIGAAPDWSAELAAAAGSTMDTPASPRDFGFPKRPPPPRPAPEFGWDHARTQRVESIDGGGILINLNDNCVLVLMPFPFGGCGLGKKPANGDLFKDMQRREQGR